LRDSPAGSGGAAFELRPSLALVALVFSWLVIASTGCLACRGLPLPWRLLAAAAVWACGLPGLRGAVMLVSRGSPARIEHRGRGSWYLEPGALAAWPSPHSLAVGPALWLAIDTARGRRCACVVDRRLMSRLRLGRPAAGPPHSNC